MFYIKFSLTASRDCTQLSGQVRQFGLTLEYITWLSRRESRLSFGHVSRDWTSRNPGPGLSEFLTSEIALPFEMMKRSMWFVDYIDSFVNFLGTHSSRHLISTNKARLHCELCPQLHCNMHDKSITYTHLQFQEEIDPERRFLSAYPQFYRDRSGRICGQK